MTPPPENLRPEARFWTVAIGTLVIIVLSVAVATAAVGYALMVHYVQETRQQAAAQVHAQAEKQVQDAKPLCTALKKINVILAKTPASDQAAHQIAADWNQFFVATHCPEILNGTYHA